MQKENMAFHSDFYLSVKHIKSSENMQTDHYHDFYEVYYYLGGEMNYFINNKSFQLKKHDLIFVDTYTFHRTFYRQVPDNERVLILFSPKMVDCLCDGEASRAITALFKARRIVALQNSADLCLIERGVKKMLETFCASGLFGDLRTELLLLEFLLCIAEISGRNSEQMEEQHIPGIKEKRMSDIVDFINRHYTSQITLEQLSKHFYINKYYLCHAFKEATGLGVIDFVNKKRLAEAERLLKYTPNSITNICNMIGFNSISNFMNLFKDQYQCTPGAFRKKNRQ